MAFDVSIVDFGFNYGKQRVIFPPKHSYYAVNENHVPIIKNYSYQLYRKNVLIPKYKKLYGLSTWPDDFILAEDIDVPTHFNLQQKINFIAKATKNAKNEIGFALDKNGKIIARFTGNDDTVKLETAIDFLKNTDDIIFTHNHPNQKHISWPDLLNAINLNFSKIIASTKDKLYIIEKPSNGWPDLDYVLDLIDELDEKALNDKNMTPEEYENYYRYNLALDLFEILNLKLKTVNYE